MAIAYRTHNLIQPGIVLSAADAVRSGRDFKPDVVGSDEVVRHEFARTHLEMSAADELSERLSGIIDSQGHRCIPAVAFLLVMFSVMPFSVAALLIFSWTL